MGVSGSGKSTVGKILAEKTGFNFYDADQFHSTENIKKMSEGVPLTDDDREPWLFSLRQLIEEQNGNIVLACSALKKSYRDILSVPGKEVKYIYLKGEKELLHKRLLERKEHYAGADLLDSQLDTLEAPKDALTISIVNEPGVIVEEIIRTYNL